MFVYVGVDSKLRYPLIEGCVLLVSFVLLSVLASVRLYLYSSDESVSLLLGLAWLLVYQHRKKCGSIMFRRPALILSNLAERFEYIHIHI